MSPSPLLTRRRFLQVSAGAACAMAVPACSSPPAVGRTVRLAGSTFGFPSPFAYIAGPGYVQMSLLYDTLLWKDGTGTLLPWIARGYERSTDGRTYTFAIRRGIRWHDGRPLTAQDVAFTFEYFLQQPLGPLLVAQPYGVDGARTVGADGVEIHLTRPAITFPEQVAGSLPIIPAHVWDQIGDAPRAQDMDVLVGSGPYQLTSFSRAEGALGFSATDDHFLGPSYVRRVELIPVDDELAALRAGEIDAAETPVDGVRPEVVAPWRADPAFQTIEAVGSFTFPLIWNLGRGGALADVTFRRACAQAIDRGAIVDRILAGAGLPGNPGFLPPDHPFHEPVEQYPFDPAGANRLLDDAGYGPSVDGVRRGPDGSPLRLSLLTSNAPVPAVLPLLIDALVGIGVRLEPTSVDLPTLYGRLQDGDDDLVLSLYPGPGGTSPDADPDLLRTFYSSRIEGRLQGAQGWVDKEFDRVAAQQLRTSDPTRRAQMVARLQQIVARDVPALPLYYPRLAGICRRSTLDAWYYTPGGFAGGLPGIRNKHVLVTGRRGGLEVRT